MAIKWLTDELAVAPQLTVQDVPQVVALGFKSIICNRPDGEAGDQPAFSDIDTAANAAGLTTRFLPVIPGQATFADVEKFAAAVSELPKPILAYCRSGARCTNLWVEAQAISGK